MYHIAICDDEEKFIEELQALLYRYSKEKGLEIRISPFKNGLDLTGKYPLDIDFIFLDIKMDGMDGLRAADKIRKKDANVSIVFLTSMAQYALEGYKYNATNYMVKPIQYARLKAEMDRWLARNKKENAYILVENDTGKYKVFLNSLSYIETFNRNLMLHTDIENLVSYKKMKDMEAELKEHHFVRCHAGFLVNLFFVKRVEKLEIELIDGARIPISQLKRKLFMEKLAEYWGDRL